MVKIHSLPIWRLYCCPFYFPKTGSYLVHPLLDIVTILQHHPQSTAIRRQEGEDLGSAEALRLVDEHLAGKVHSGNDVGPDTQLVQRLVLEVVARVEADDAGHERVGAEDAGRQRCDLVLGSNLLLLRLSGRDGLQHIDAVLRAVLALRGRQGGVGHEAAVVETSRKVEGAIVLEGIAHGYDGDLKRGCVNCETIVKESGGASMTTYEEEIVGEETLLARRQESLDSVHF